MKKIAYSVAAVLAAGTMAPAANAASFLLTLNATPNAIPAAANAFSSDLSGLGLGLIGLGQVQLDGDYNITFELMGSESGFADTFRTSFVIGGVTIAEFTTGIINNFLSGTNTPTQIQTASFGGGVNLPIEFRNNNNAVISNPGTVGFGTLITAGMLDSAGGALNAGDVLDLGDVVYFAYDDQVAPNDDDNHDDLIIRATLSPVPEPATWAFMLVGFGAVGYALRRRPAYKMAQAV